MAEELYKENYGLSASVELPRIEAPELAYRPGKTNSYNPAIGLIGCGHISIQHLQAYQNAGFRITALCDKDPDKVEERQRQFFPEAAVYTDYQDLLQHGNVEVVDIALHPLQRLPVMKDALMAGKHVLSQKPFVLNLEEGRELVTLAKKQQVKLAVNQSGRWAPHFSYIREAVRSGIIGEVMSAQLSVHWHHDWIMNTPYEESRHVILYDFGIHWFDLITILFHNKTPQQVYASVARSSTQQVKPPMLAQVSIQFPSGEASLFFNADTRFGRQNTTVIVGTKGIIQSVGPSLSEQKVTIHTEAGIAEPTLEGNWFPDGFQGAMAELLCAIEENREPVNNASDNLVSLALCFTAIASADTGLPQIPGRVETINNLTSK